VPHRGEGDDILLSEDRNPNTNGARLLGVTGEPGAQLASIAQGVASGLGQSDRLLRREPARFRHHGRPTFAASGVRVDRHPRECRHRLRHSAAPGRRLRGEARIDDQRQGPAATAQPRVRPPGNARDDWEILRDLIQEYSGQNGIYMIEEVFKQMSESVQEFAGLSLSKIGDHGVQVMQINESPSPDEPGKDEGNKPESEKAAN
jgi:NADH-quinone oxidoreductase subunit G